VEAACFGHLGTAGINSIGGRRAAEEEGEEKELERKREDKPTHCCVGYAEKWHFFFGCIFQVRRKINVTLQMRVSKRQTHSAAVRDVFAEQRPPRAAAFRELRELFGLLAARLDV
jgi:hypothetical protein